MYIAVSGHNVCILGRAGVGKSVQVKEIKKEFDKMGLNARIVCLSEIAFRLFRE